MAWAVDTNILKHLTQPGTPEHAKAKRAVELLWTRGERPVTLAQCMIEFWGFLTRPSLRDAAAIPNPGLGLSVAKAEIELQKVDRLFGCYADTAVLYAEWRRIVVLYEVKGKQVHDAHIAAAAHMHGISHLLTYNVTDFTRYSAFLTAVRPEDV